jgi:hypothetical protein
MKKLQFSVLFSLMMLSIQAQEFADFEITVPNQGTGTFENAVLPNFTWNAVGTINGETNIRDNEIFEGGSQFENTFGQADTSENLNIRIDPNGSEMVGRPISSRATLTINFDEITPAGAWGFCVVDIDVENCLISAIDENDDPVSVQDINEWLVELFDANPIEKGVNLPKWDPGNAALLGASTDPSYVLYNDEVIGGLEDTEAAAAFFMPNIRLKSLMVEFENLQGTGSPSYHFYIASQFSTAVNEQEVASFSVYPNPASSILNIQSIHSDRGTLNVYNMAGQQIYMDDIFAPGKDISVDNWPKGEYLLELITTRGRSVKKIIIQH